MQADKAEVRTIVCLANSRKVSGRCIAGKELVEGGPGAWFRPVSSRPEEEVSEEERQYQDGTDPQVLDIVSIPIIGPYVGEHNPFQIENHRIDPRCYWVRLGKLDFVDLGAFVDQPEILWVNSYWTYHGLNDRVPTDEAWRLRGSLYLLRLGEATARVFAPSAAFGNPKRRVQIQFTHEGVPYRLWTSDPLVERHFLAGPDGTYELGPGYATISLAEPYDGFCYKVVAMLLPDAWRAP